ncbi:DeoR/GlpR family DNA-binding transcription regulator [Tetragenococcus halophilus]|uniref:Lactose phosphotransferase system repressor n=1 Tax=Tetragenococcus halophilus (strain DSM 20338 / JCM 20259 / NCIMB 9735 / NBRC 12172) TaxID=945021 RepID=A0AAN1SIS8_TETHN|nr:DeoR/GlpR family DNA-binding transcription regulator [Tetragenococcus halophilus]BAK95829.1 lactose operon repressor [Tetragenococcus halophilus NBRC 12172]GBD71289.1 lactose operon repressor [Tetragenococcus halophilus subsp. halophilus]GFK23212.1 DeoR family transcriptional regulator [Tetragenococcus halophilus]GFK27838.1 DeoR family transcriptional regulator [Tetragenococcus halophilus]GLL50313.1 DeoR family transcriptional regulator [Tetragenococcus halophilus]
MLKEERLDAIVTLVDQKRVIKVNDIVDRLGVSDMTVRRDLTELEKAGRLKRVHGGAQTLNVYRPEELSHADKQIINKSEKKEIAQKALKLIQEDETIYLGPGTTIELLAEIMNFENLRVVTNCLPVFQTLRQKKGNIKVYLLGGEMRELTKAFFGEITNKALQDMHFHRAFFSSNAVKGNEIMTATIEEGQTQAIALDNSVNRYLLIDSSKVEKEDFYTYYNLSDVTAVVMNQDDYDMYQKVEKEVQVIV